MTLARAILGSPIVDALADKTDLEITYRYSIEEMPMSSIKETDTAAKAVQKGRRVALSDIEAAIMARYEFTGAEAVGALRAMFPPTIEALQTLSICILVMRNGFTVIGKSAAADPANFNADLCRQFAYEDAIRQLWPLMGFALRDELHRAAE
jgi:hypothetical protein